MASRCYPTIWLQRERIHWSLSAAQHLARGANSQRNAEVRRSTRHFLLHVGPLGQQQMSRRTALLQRHPRRLKNDSRRHHPRRLQRTALRHPTTIPETSECLHVLSCLFPHVGVSALQVNASTTLSDVVRVVSPTLINGDQASLQHIMFCPVMLQQSSLAILKRTQPTKRRCKVSSSISG